MDRETVALNDLIKTRLDEIAEDAWNEHRVIRVDESDARWLSVGSGAVIERWRCQRDHGNGPCGAPLVPEADARTLLSSPDFSPMADTPDLSVTVQELDGDFGFMSSELHHYADLVAAYRRFLGGTERTVDKLIRLKLSPVARLAALHIWLQQDPQTTAEVAKALGVTPKTALKALTELQADGRARKVHSVWTYQAAF
ncbi:hypothetical protein [Streptomyces sp. NPDC059651]|uniref:hypothetical protein n=1 Tax=Streptomyces sp. NPDC059651 TaxID=3346897 RepID=UPI0036BF9D70